MYTRKRISKYTACISIYIHILLLKRARSEKHEINCLLKTKTNELCTNKISNISINTIFTIQILKDLMKRKYVSIDNSFLNCAF